MWTDNVQEHVSVAPSTALRWPRIGAAATWAYRVWVAQFVATVGAAIAAVVDIESIVWTGPIATSLGLIMAFMARPLRSWSVFRFGISAPLVWIVCALWIVIADLGPYAAQVPVSTYLVVCAALSTPLAWLALQSIRQRVGRPSATAWQFSLRSLLILTTVVCVVLCIARLIPEVSNTDERIGFALFVAIVLALCGGAAWFFLRGHRQSPMLDLWTPGLSPEATRMAETLVASGFFATVPDAITASLRSMMRQLNVQPEPAGPVASDDDAKRTRPHSGADPQAG